MRSSASAAYYHNPNSNPNHYFEYLSMAVEFSEILSQIISQITLKWNLKPANFRSIIF